MNDPHIFGIRHHGPGSARSLVRSLHTLQPDILLIEGPPEGDNTLPLLAESSLTPPVALLIYSAKETTEKASAVYYPYALFSPEWQAIQYGLNNNLPIRFIDLPQSHQMAMQTKAKAANLTQSVVAHKDLAASPDETTLSLDPLSHLAKIAGYKDSERWWEHLVEQRQNIDNIFEAIFEAMSELRAARSPSSTQDPRRRRESLREAHMRTCIRRAQKEGYEKIAVVCGAWHTPALMPDSTSQTADRTLLKGLPKTTVSATWIPWTYARLSNQSGYGAGINSPGWYHHLWESSEQQKTPTESTISWLTRVARLLRDEDLDAAPASVIEAVRLAQTLAALRGMAMPGLDELTEATQATLCHGDATPLTLISQKLIVGDRIGHIPENAPLMPLQQDLARQQKRCRIKPEADERLLTLDLRKPLDLSRSQLLHRLALLNIPWGIPQQTQGQGTFKEAWRLRWSPELSLGVIEASYWGMQIADAAAACVRHRAEQTDQLSALTALLEGVLLAGLSDAIAPLMNRVRTVATLSSDVTHIMAALPPLVNTLRYRDVRQTDSTAVRIVIDGLVLRLCIGLPNACMNISDDVAEDMRDAIARVHSAIQRLQDPDHQQRWVQTLHQLCRQDLCHGLIAGYSCRRLLDGNHIPAETAALHLNQSLSTANNPLHAAAWIAGFLQGSGLLLLHDDGIWRVIDRWLNDLSPETFTVLLPLLRRTFSEFPAPERKQIGEKVKRESVDSPHSPQQETLFSSELANKTLTVTAQLLGLHSR